LSKFGATVVLFDVHNCWAAKGNKVGDIRGQTMPELIGGLKIDGAVWQLVLKVDGHGDSLPPPLEGKARGGKHGATLFHFQPKRVYQHN
jgi:hypothetical protein